MISFLNFKSEVTLLLLPQVETNFTKKLEQLCDALPDVEIVVAVGNVERHELRKLRLLEDKSIINGLIEYSGPLRRFAALKRAIALCKNSYLLFSEVMLSAHDFEAIIRSTLPMQPFDVAGVLRNRSRDPDYEIVLQRQSWFGGFYRFSGTRINTCSTVDSKLFMLRKSFFEKHDFPAENIMQLDDQRFLGDLVAQQNGSMLGLPIFQELFDKCPVELENESQNEAFEPRKQQAKLLAEANTKASQGEPEVALQLFRRAARLTPDSPEALLAVGNCLRTLNRHEEACEAYEQALKLRPFYSEVLNNLALSLDELGLAEQAEINLRKGLKAEPSNYSLLHNLGNLLTKACKREESLRYYKLALLSQPQSIISHVAIAKVYAELGQAQAAILHFRLALHESPNLIDCHVALGKLLLAQGEYEAGLYELEFRVLTPLLLKGALNTSFWRGESLSGKHLLVIQDGNICETILLLRYVKLLINQGVRITLACDKNIAALHDDFAGLATVSIEDPLPAHDLHIRLLSLPCIFATRVNNIPQEFPYLSTRKPRSKKSAVLKIGISWRDFYEKTPTALSDSLKQSFEKLSKLPEVKLVSLQSGLLDTEISWLAEQKLASKTCSKNQLVEFKDALGDVDLVICPDGALANLAGAIAKPTFVILPLQHQWLWHSSGILSAWFPSCRLYRSPAEGLEAVAVQRMVEDLRGVLLAEDEEKSLSAEGMAKDVTFA